jgi:hypothetical protein
MGKINTHWKLNAWGLSKPHHQRANYHQSAGHGELGYRGMRAHIGDKFVAIEQTDYLYDEIPESVACELLDFIQSGKGSSRVIDGFVIGVKNLSEYNVNSRRWTTEFTAYAFPEGKALEQLYNPDHKFDIFGPYRQNEKTVFIRHIIHVDYDLIDKGYTAVDVNWK